MYNVSPFPFPSFFTPPYSSLIHLTPSFQIVQVIAPPLYLSPSSLPFSSLHNQRIRTEHQTSSPTLNGCDGLSLFTEGITRKNNQLLSTQFREKLGEKR